MMSAERIPLLPFFRAEPLLLFHSNTDSADERDGKKDVARLALPPPSPSRLGFPERFGGVWIFFGFVELVTESPTRQNRTDDTK